MESNPTTDQAAIAAELNERKEKAAVKIEEVLNEFELGLQAVLIYGRTQINSNVILVDARKPAEDKKEDGETAA